MTKYIALNYFSYHTPTYVASLGCVILFSIFLAMMYLGLKYEILNKQNKCNPQFYYGKPCNNLISEKLLLNPEFSEAKKTFYDSLSSYHPKSQISTGAVETIEKSDYLINEVSGPFIETSMEENQDFLDTNTNEINTATSLLQLLSLKYLGNLQDLFENVKSIPENIQQQLNKIPNELQNLRILVKNSLVDPTYTKYSAPLNKLYQSLSEIKEPPIVISGPSSS